jgi:hypothetical protein
MSEHRALMCAMVAACGIQVFLRVDNVVIDYLALVVIIFSLVRIANT